MPDLRPDLRECRQIVAEPAWILSTRLQLLGDFRNALAAVHQEDDRAAGITTLAPLAPLTLTMVLLDELVDRT